jgi:hypothetical protein
VKSTLIKHLAAIPAFALFNMAAHAAIIASEDFTYSNGQLVGDNGGTGWAAAWTTPGTFGTTSGLVESGQFRGTSSTANNFNSRAISTTFTGSPTVPLYFSALFTNPSDTGAHALLLAVSDNATVNDNDVRIGLADGKFSAKLEGGANNTTVDGDFGTAALNTQYLVVGKLEFNVSGANDRLTVWIDPTGVETATASNTITGQDLGWVTPTHATVGQFNVSGRGIIDEVRIGSAWSDVAAIPEPGSLALIGIAVGSLVIARRRR